MAGQWHGGKGSAPRKGSNRKAFSDGYDRIFGDKKSKDISDGEKSEANNKNSDTDKQNE